MMSVFDNGYSRFVAWVKIVLPLAALVLLSTMFLLSRSYDTPATIPFADIDVNELASEPRIKSPNYTGMTRDGSSISVAAETAKPDPENRDLIIAAALRAELETASGALYNLVAATGHIDSGRSVALLEGGVVVTTSSGYEITTQAMTTSLSHTELETEGDVHAIGPAGTLDAGKMILTPDNLLVFKGGVKLVYTPSSD